ncbi:hypothetical protein HK096_002725, partial [Nowakowskiella sp. JEL0078]
MFPGGFGSKSKAQKPTNAEFDKTKRNKTIVKTRAEQIKFNVEEDDLDDFTPALPPRSNRNENIGSDDDDDSFEDDDEETIVSQPNFPITNEVQLLDHGRVVCALSLDPAGSRLITGSRDCFVKMWDFAGMNESLRPFRAIEPCGGNPITDLNFSTTGDNFLIASGEWIPKLYSRDGVLVNEFMKGDMGHVAALTSSSWHPNEKGTFMTTAGDSTVRIWDVEQKRSQKTVICVKSKVRGGISRITAGTYSGDGRIIVAGAEDGALRIWNSNGPFISPTKTLESAHQPNSAITSIVLPSDTFTIISRGMDDTLKLFDMRNFKSPVQTISSLPTFFEETNVILSPDERYLLTGLSVKKGDSKLGSLKIIDRIRFEVVGEFDVGEGSAVKCLWNERINQIIVGMGSGGVHVLFDPDLSTNGAKLCIGKEKKTKVADELLDFQEQIFLPNTLPFAKDDLPSEIVDRRPTTMRSRKERDARKPDMPHTLGPGKGGKIGSSLTAHLMKGIIKDTSRDEDPREAFLRHAQNAEDDPYWVNPAYKKTQPKPVYAEHVHEDEDEAKRDAKK